MLCTFWMITESVQTHVLDPFSWNNDWIRIWVRCGRNPICCRNSPLTPLIPIEAAIAKIISIKIKQWYGCFHFRKFSNVKYGVSGLRKNWCEGRGKKVAYEWEKTPPRTYQQRPGITKTNCSRNLVQYVVGSLLGQYEIRPPRDSVR